MSYGSLSVEREDNAMKAKCYLAYPLGLAAAVCVLPIGAQGFPRVPVAEAAEPEELPKEIIADQIRRQGFACVNPESAKRDRELSKPDNAVWVLKCDGVTYRISLTPDMAAKVERLD
jgi:hypothetical protein